MSLEKDRTRKVAVSKDATDVPDGQCGDVDDTGCESLNLRHDLRGAPLGRNRDAPVSVRDGIARHRAQSRRLAEHTAMPMYGQPVGNDAYIID